MKKNLEKMKRALRRGMATVLALCSLSSLLVVDAAAASSATIKANNDAMKLTVDLATTGDRAGDYGKVTNMTTDDCYWLFLNEQYTHNADGVESFVYDVNVTVSETFYTYMQGSTRVNPTSGNKLYTDYSYFWPSMKKDGDNSYQLINSKRKDDDIIRDHSEIGWQYVPLKVTVTVPAKSTAEVTYGFDMYEEQVHGMFSAGILNADCNDAAKDTDTTAKGAMLTSTDTIQTKNVRGTADSYGVKNNADLIAGCMIDPAGFWNWSNVKYYTKHKDWHAYDRVTSYKLKSGVTIPENLYGSMSKELIGELTGKTPTSNDTACYASNYGEKTFTFVNNEDTEQTFTRYFVYYKFHNAFWGAGKVHADTDPIHDGNGKTTISVASYKISPISGEQTVTDENIQVTRPSADSEEQVADNPIVWSDVDDFDNDVIGKIRDASDQDYHTAQGWYRLQMSPLTEGGSFSSGSGYAPSLYSNGQLVVKDSSTAYQYVIADGETPTISAKVSDAYPTQSVSSYGHPLPGILKYAWLSNGTYSTNGAVGYDYVKPEGEVKLKSNAFDNDAAAGANSMDDYDCWLIKYAGKQRSHDTFYLALEGADGQRRLLVNVPCYLAGGLEQVQTVLVTAAEYDAHPELYQTLYGWPTVHYTDAGTYEMTESDAVLHSDSGMWEKATGERIKLLDESLTGEAFTMKLSGNLCWQVDEYEWIDGEKCYQSFVNRPVVDTDSLKDDPLYQYYMAQKAGNTNMWKDLQKWDDLVTELLKQMKNNYYTDNAVGITYRGDAELGSNGDMELDADKFVFSMLDPGFNADEYEGFTFKMKLGTYATVGDSKSLYVGEGETLVIGSDVTLQSDQTLNIAEGGTMEVRGILTNMGTINCYGTIQVESGGCIKSNSATQDGKYNFVGGTLIIGTDGIFYPENKNGADQINFKSSSVYNDGLFVASTGFTLTDSRFENNVNGVVFIAGGLRKSIEINGVRTVAESIQRGMPEYDETWKPLHDSYVMYPEMPISRMYAMAIKQYPKLSLMKQFAKAISLKRDTLTNMNKLYINGASYYCNNGVTYDWGGIKTSGNNVVLFGAHEFIHYLDMTKSDDSYRIEHQISTGFISGWYANEWFQYNYEKEIWQYLYTGAADGSDKTALYDYNKGVDQIDSTVKAAFGADCLTLDSAMSHLTGYTAGEWNNAFNEAGNYTPPAVLNPTKYEGSGGC